MKLLSIIAGAAVAAALTTTAYGQVVVSSKIDTEGGVLGNIIAQMLQANDIETENRIQLGATPIVREAIAAGQIDIYPEYTGNGAFLFGLEDEDVWNDAQAGFDRVAEMDLAENGVVWLTPSPANNTWAIAVRSDVAEENGLATMSDFGAYIADGGEIVLAASSEFVTSPAALPAFQEAYGFELSSDQLIQLSGGDTAATISAAANQTSGANAAMFYGTDGGIAPSGLVVMDDDMGVQPVYAPAPIIRQDVLDEYPQIAEILAPVFEGLTLEVLQDLNGRVQVGGEPAEAVAESYLTENGFL